MQVAVGLPRSGAGSGLHDRRFETADGTILERDVGFVMLYLAGRSSPSIVVFGHSGDMTLLGAFGLEGLNLRVDVARRELVPAGPVPAATMAMAFC